MACVLLPWRHVAIMVTPHLLCFRSYVTPWLLVTLGCSQTFVCPLWHFHSRECQVSLRVLFRVQGSYSGFEGPIQGLRVLFRVWGSYSGFEGLIQGLGILLRVGVLLIAPTNCTPLFSFPYRKTV